MLFHRFSQHFTRFSTFFLPPGNAQDSQTFPQAVMAALQTAASMGPWPWESSVLSSKHNPTKPTKQLIMFHHIFTTLTLTLKKKKNVPTLNFPVKSFTFRAPHPKSRAPSSTRQAYECEVPRVSKKNGDDNYNHIATVHPVWFSQKHQSL